MDSLNDKQKLEAFLALHSTKKGCNWRCLSPDHEDKNPSASVIEGIGGRWRLYCHVCEKSWDRFDLMDIITGKAAGTSFRESNGFPIQETKPKQENVQKSTHMLTKAEKSTRIYSLKEIENGGTSYKYTNPTTQQIELIVKRNDQGNNSKSFAQFRPGNGGFVAGGLSRLPLYNRTRVLAEKVVVVCEGEKPVHALHSIGIVATTKPCGAQSPEKADWSPLYGKTVVLWPDNDSKGIKYMQAVKELLLPHCKVKWIDPAKYTLRPKADAYDWIEGIKYEGNFDNDPDGFASEARRPIDEAVDCGASVEVIQYFEDIISGKLKEVNWPWSMLTDMTSCLIPDSTNLFVGGGGAGKSLALVEAMARFMDDGIEFVAYELESVRILHLQRALAMRVGNSKVTKMKWIKNNPSKIRGYYREHKDWMDEFGSRLQVPPTGIGQKELCEWMGKQAKTKRVIIIDPISIADQDLHKNAWDSDRLFIKKTEEIAKKNGVSIINVSHPRGEGYRPSLDNIKGSKAWPNFTHNVLWMEPIEKTNVFIRNWPGTLECEINRRMHLLKARVGECEYSAALGFLFDHTTLRLHEVGLIVPKPKEKK